MLYFLMVSLLFLIGPGDCLMCYSCHQTSHACIYGNTDELYIVNCSEPNSVCVTSIYEAEVRGNFVTAAARGCQQEQPPPNFSSICSYLMRDVKEHNQRRRGKFCKICNETLCNSTSGVVMARVLQLLYYLLLVISFVV